MSNCNITSTIALDCLDSISGIKGLWVSSNADLGTIVAGSTAGITSLVGATGTFFEIQIAKDSASFTETFNVSNVNGTAFFQQELTVPVQHLSSATRAQLQLLAYNRDIKAVFEDANGNFWLIGAERGAVISTGTSVTGTAVGDYNGYNVTLTAQEPQMAYQVSSLSALTGMTITSV